MKILILSTVFLASMITLAGCQTIKSTLGKRDNGSLDYRKTQKLDPIRLPQGQQAATFVPLYDTPDVTSEQVAPLTNDSGRQYQLPAPPKITQ